MTGQFIGSKRAIVMLVALAVVIGGAALLITKQFPAGFTQSPSSSTCVTNPHTCDASGRPIPSNSAAGVNPGLSATVPSANAFIAPPAHAFIVTTYGADASGQHDATAAIQKTIQAAEAAGSHNTVYFPAGTYLLDRNDGQRVDFEISGPRAPDILGAGRDLSTIVEKVGTVAYPGVRSPKTVFSLSKLSGTVFSGLTVDTQTYNAGDALDDFGDNTRIEHARFLGAQNQNTFTLRVLAVCSASPSSKLYGVHHSGNVINDIILSGRGVGGNDDLDFSCQWDGRISNVTDVGWGIALYVDRNVTITNYNFTPGPAEKDPRGWYVSASSNITINNFVTSGQGGIIKSPNNRSAHIVINNEQMTRPGFNLVIGDADDVVISNSTLSGLLIDPNVSANGIRVTASSLGSVQCRPHPGATITGLAGLQCR